MNAECNVNKKNFTLRKSLYSSLYREVRYTEGTLYRELTGLMLGYMHKHVAIISSAGFEFERSANRPYSLDTIFSTLHKPTFQ